MGGGERQFTCLCKGLPIYVQLQPPKTSTVSAHTISDNRILHSGGVTHRQITGNYAEKKKSHSGKKTQQISYSEIERGRVNRVTFSLEDYNGVID